MSKVLQEYLLYRKGEADDYLFPTENSTNLKRSGLQSAIKRYNLSRGVNKTSMHLFRHTFAKKWFYLVVICSDYKRY
ncbi:MAG: tyrosine-type recombinase/integrase [bacterium]